MSNSRYDNIYKLKKVMVCVLLVIIFTSLLHYRVRLCVLAKSTSTRYCGVLKVIVSETNIMSNTYGHISLTGSN